MDMSGFLSSDSNDGNDSAPSRADAVESGAALLDVAHALTDFVLSDDANILSFTAMMDSTSPADMREVIQAAHNVFAALAARAKAELFMTKLFSGNVSLADLGDDGDLPDLSVFGI
jgi:hypothetical protein